MNKVLYFDVTRKQIIKSGISNIPANLFVPLSADQIDFYTNHPEASYAEILNMELRNTSAPDISEIKLQAIERLSMMSQARMSEIIPDYKVFNVISGVYDSQTTPTATEVLSEYKRIGEMLRNDFYRLKGLIQAANTIEEIREIEMSNNFNTIG